MAVGLCIDWTLRVPVIMRRFYRQMAVDSTEGVAVDGTRDQTSAYAAMAGLE